MDFILTAARTMGEKARAHPLPSALLFIFVIFTLLGISGSSMGAFDKIMTGKTPGIIAGEPRIVRSDEWGWQTQETFVQRGAGYPEFNKKIGLGENTSMILDVPFKSFFALFKPQNLFFFVMPFANAFAAKWWFMSLVLGSGFYFLFDALFPNRRLLISLGALLLLFNPFTQWWYQSITLLALGYALWASFFVVKIFTKDPDTKRLGLYGLGLAYYTLCFIFLLYPPFQLPVAYVVLALLAGFFYHRYSIARVSFVADRKRWLAIMAALVLTLLVAGTFYATHRQIIHDINHTVYPAVRNIQSGQSSGPGGASFNILSTFSSPILFKLQDTLKAPNFYTNQSEAARIVAINLVLLPMILFQILKKPLKSRKLADCLLLSTTILAGIFMVRMFTPLFNLPFKILLFNKVQNERLALGLALLCAVQLVLVGIFITNKLSAKKAAVAALLAFALFYDASNVMSHHYPGFVSNSGMLAACLLIGVCVFLLLRKKTFIYGLVLFLLFSIGSSIFINPLYARSEPLALKDITNHLASRYPDQQKAWVVLGSVTFENVPLAVGKPSLSGIQYYPQFKLWQPLDPEHKEVNAYNRFAHVVFTTDQVADNKTFRSPQDDVLYVRFNCSIARKLPNLGYVLSSENVDTKVFTCLKQDDVIVYPKATLRVYKYTE